MLGVWGICAIFDFLSKRSKYNKSKSEAVMGILGLAAGIAAVVISVLALFMLEIRIILDIIILGIFDGWLIVNGITTVAMSFKAKKSGSKIWILTLMLDVLVLFEAFTEFSI